ncbi:hypothetical protein NZ698_00545 [Chryseobacterium sp. PBS4-4]|uniref:Uncharacterized protein n=1 Tax=Chryseobacterium edaphi TaxID=2976532 RepID=A0ABT2W098_9FLAO|nr:hypothetical protein [Chryseobacterium edaphi]MCU7615669.1 hypothetical protein [Chryseobacterium edaphi]
MSLAAGKPILKQTILQIFEIEAQANESPEQSRERIAEKLTNAIYDFVKTGMVKVTVATTGTAAAQTGTGTGNIE